MARAVTEHSGRFLFDAGGGIADLSGHDEKGDPHPVLKEETLHETVEEPDDQGAQRTGAHDQIVGIFAKRELIGKPPEEIAAKKCEQNEPGQPACPQDRVVKAVKINDLMRKPDAEKRMAAQNVSHVIQLIQSVSPEKTEIMRVLKSAVPGIETEDIESRKNFSKDRRIQRGEKHHHQGNS